MNELVLMRNDTDCEVATIANACQVSYDDAKEAIDHFQFKGLECPIVGNPWNLYRALISLGYWKKNITFDDLINGVAKENETIILIHNPENPLFNQHWVTWGGIQDKFWHKLYWGNSIEPKMVSSASLERYYKRGWPNCAFQVYKANVFRVMWERLKRFIFGEKL